MEYIIQNSDELTHWGVRGMKWGVRRYQNKDGSLTAAGKKRRAKLEGELEKLGGEKKSETKSASGSSSGSGQKSISEMTIAELRAATERMTAEKNYYDAQKNLASAVPQKSTSAGRKYAEKFLNESVLPAVTNTAKTYMENFMKKQLGLNTKDELTELKRTFDILDTKQKIDKIKNPDKYLSYDDKKKKREYDDETKKREKDYKDLETTKKELDQVRKELEEERKKRTEQGGS